MRVIAALVMLVASCRFDPLGSGLPADAADGDASEPPADGAADAPADAAADGGAIDASPGNCPASYDVAHGTSRYSFRPIAQWRVLAVADCVDDLPGRTHLATFEAVADMTAIVDLVNPGDSATPYVGATCVDANCNLRASWRWDTGAAIDVAAWADLQPDNGGSERAARVEKDRVSGEWRLFNVADTSTLPYICECDP